MSTVLQVKIETCRHQNESNMLDVFNNTAVIKDIFFMYHKNGDENNNTNWQFTGIENIVTWCVRVHLYSV